jgi:glucose-6-phosphate 1-dehydrogenase
MKHKIKSHIIVIFGASGDLSKRKLIPAIYSLFKQNLLSKRQLILGAGRSHIPDDVYRQDTYDFLIEVNPDETVGIKDFCKHLFYQSLDTANEAEYIKIKDRLSVLKKEFDIDANYLFYLSTPPSLYYKIPEALAKIGLNNRDDGFNRIIIEKPFGNDEASARELNKHLLKYYREKQLFRIDHYLGKETVQNLLAFRFANAIFEPLWNSNHIENIQIFANESIGIENRGGYYDHAGAIKDMVQNHLLQLLCIAAMEPPANMDSYSIRNETLKVLQSIRIYKTDEEMDENVVIGQYLGGEGENSYREENNVERQSHTETYAAIRFYIDNWRWHDVPFYIRTGKRLDKRVSEVVINFKSTPHPFFSKTQRKEQYKNQLVIRIQPDEGIKLTFAAKEPGTGFKTHEMDMSFFYSDFANKKIPPAYERLILDALLGDNTLFSRNDAVEACWSIVDPIINYVSKNAAERLHFYESGSHGPKAADRLLAKSGHKWRNPKFEFDPKPKCK